MEIGILDCFIVLLVMYIVAYIVAVIQKKYYDKTFYKKLRDSYENKKKQSES